MRFLEPVRLGVQRRGLPNERWCVYGQQERAWVGLSAVAPGGVVRPALTRAQLERLNGGPLPLMVCVAPVIGPAVPVASTPEEAQRLAGGSLEGWRQTFARFAATGPVTTYPLPSDLHAEADQREHALAVIGRRLEDARERLLDLVRADFERWLEAP